MAKKCNSRNGRNELLLYKKNLPVNGQIKAKQDKAVFQSFLIPNQSVFNEAFCFTIMFYNTRLSFDQTRPVVDHFRLTDPRAQVLRSFQLDFFITELRVQPSFHTLFYLWYSYIECTMDWKVPIGISELCLSFYSHPNLSDGNFILVPHFNCTQKFQIDLLRPK